MLMVFASLDIITAARGSSQLIPPALLWIVPELSEDFRSSEELMACSRNPSLRLKSSTGRHDAVADATALRSKSETLLRPAERAMLFWFILDGLPLAV